MDWGVGSMLKVAIQSELTRALRGDQSREGLSRKLSTSANQIYRWESGRQLMRWPAFVKLCRLKQVNLDGQLKSHFDFSGDPLNTKILVRNLIGDVSINEASARSGMTRFQLSRWLSARATPKLLDVLSLMKNTRFAMVEFLDDLVGIELLPSLREEALLKKIERQVTYELPYAAAILVLLGTEGYRRLKTHRPEFIARKLGISLAQERMAIDALSQAGIIKSENRKYSAKEHTLDTRGDFRKNSFLKAYWLSRELDLLKSLEQPPPNSLFGFNVLAVSDLCADKIRQEYFNFFDKVRTLVANDHLTPTQVRVLSIQIFDPSESGTPQKNAMT